MGSNAPKPTARAAAILSAGLRAFAALCLAALAIFAPIAAQAQTAANANANAQSGDAAVSVTEPGALSNTGDLDFGRIITSPVAGTVTVAPNGDVSSTGGVILLGGDQPASFLLERRVGIDYPVSYAPTLPDTVELVHNLDPTATMTMRDLTSDFNRTRQIFIFTVPGWWNRTEYDFRVGGTLDVPANQQAGEYTGTFQVSVDFQ